MNTTPHSTLPQNQTPIATEIYLGKAGQTFGPYTVEQFESMRAQPDFGTYTYLWDGRDENPQWKPLETAPTAPTPKKAGPGAPPPDMSPSQAQPPVEASAKVLAFPQQPKAALATYDAPGIEALCHDSRTVVGGKLVKITDAGCELVSDQNTPIPGFGSKANVILNLLDSKSGKSMNVQARLTGMRRQAGGWTYLVRWEGCPELVAQQLVNAA